jgi:hypothetical protein
VSRLANSRRIAYERAGACDPRVGRIEIESDEPVWYYPVLNADQLVAVKRQTVDAVGSYVAWPRDLGDRAG